jgi:hypothetical protein
MNTFDEMTAAISNTMHYGNGDLYSLRKQFVQGQYKISVFLDKFIEKMGAKLDGDRDNSPEWKLYTSKTKTYNDYDRAIRIVDYHTAKKTLGISN